MHALFIKIPAQGCHYAEFLCNNGRLSQPAPPFTVSRWEPAGKLFFFVDTFNETAQLCRDSLLKTKVSVMRRDIKAKTMPTLA